MKSFFAALLFLSLAAVSAAQSDPDYFWYYYTLDNDAPIGSSTNLIFDSTGLPHVAYGRDVETKGLKYAKFDGEQWNITVVDPDGHGRINMTLDKFDNPHIIYHADVGGYAVKYAHFDGVDWNTQTVDVGLSQYVFYDTTIEVDDNGIVHMTYVKTTGDIQDVVTYATINSGVLTAGEPLVQRLSGLWSASHLNDKNDLVLAMYGFPGILWGSLTNGQWQIDNLILDELADFEYGAMLSLDYKNNSYYMSIQDIDRSRLWLAVGRGDDWQVEQVAETSGGNRFSATCPVAVDDQGNVFIAYYSAADGNLMMAYKNSNAWVNALVDSIGDVGEHAALAITPEGLPAITYFDASNGHLRYAVASLTPPEDSDGDLIVDYIETINGTNPLDMDSDDDGISDGTEDANFNGIVDAGESDPKNFDTDGDGLSDGLEIGLTQGLAGAGSILGTDAAVFVQDLDPTTQTNNLVFDTDNDGLSDGAEDANGNGRCDVSEPDPLDPDTDNDGLTDGIEVAIGCGPIDIDSDDDGLADFEEDVNLNGVVDDGETNPADRDSDNDGLSDGVEIGLTSIIQDPDGAGKLLATDVNVFIADADPSTTTDPLNQDTDADQALDGQEDVNRNGKFEADESDPLVEDTDGDGLTDGVEWYSNLNPTDWDSDDDGIADQDEDVNGNGFLDVDETSPSNADTDGDKLPDGLELGLTAGIPDPDGDGLLKGTDMALFVKDADTTTTTDPLDADTDDDNIIDGDEDINLNGRHDAGETDPLNWDTDGDNVADGDEITLGTDPLDPGSVTFSQMLYQDEFLDEDLSEWTIVDDGHIEGPSNWYVHRNSLVQLSNIFGGFALDDPNDRSMLGTYIMTGDQSWQDYLIEFELFADDDDALGVMFRYQDGDNYYRFSMSKELQKAWCMRFSGGSYEILAEVDFDYELGVWHNARISVVDSHFEFLLNDKRVLGATDSTFAGGGIAFYTWKNAGAAFRNLQIRGNHTTTHIEAELIHRTEVFSNDTHRTIAVELALDHNVHDLVLEAKHQSEKVVVLNSYVVPEEQTGRSHEILFRDNRPWEHVHYRLSLYDNDGSKLASRELVPDDAVVNDFKLVRAYPNPFADRVELVLQSRAQAFMRYRVYNILGRLVYETADRAVTAGWSTVQWDGRSSDRRFAPNGTYIIRFEFFQDEKMGRPLRFFDHKVSLVR